MYWYGKQFYLHFSFTSWMSSYFSLNSLCSYHPLSLGKGDLLSWLTAAPRTSSAEELTDVPEQDTALSLAMTNHSKQAPVDETLEETWAWHLPQSYTCTHCLTLSFIPGAHTVTHLFSSSRDNLSVTWSARKISVSNIFTNTAVIFACRKNG